MPMRRSMVSMLLAALVVTALPAAAQERSPLPTSGAPGSVASPAVSPEPSAPAGPDPSASAPTGSGGPVTIDPRWAIVRDVDVVRSGVLRHVVTLGEAAVALAPTTGRDGQTRVRVLVTSDGTTWSRRGRIELTGAVRDLVADDGTLLAVGWDDGATIWRSVNGGRTWTLPQDPAPFAGGADGLPALDEDADIAAIARGPAGLLAVGTTADPQRTARRGAAWRSADGVAWERLAGAGTLPPFLDIAADAAIYVAAGSDPAALRWSPDGVTWTDASVDLAPGEGLAGVVAVPGLGFLAWGASMDARGPLMRGPLIWTSADGRTWARGPLDAALAGAQPAEIRAIEGGPPAMGVGGRPTGAFTFAWLGDAWQRERIRGRGQLCARDITALGAVLIVVGGTCGADTQRGRAWVAALEP